MDNKEAQQETKREAAREMPETLLQPDSAAVTGSDPNATPHLSGGRQEHPHDEDLPYAGFWRRALAMFLDILLITGIEWLTLEPVRRAQGIPITQWSWIDTLSVVVRLLYFILFTWWTGQTLGKMVCRIKVINTNPRANTRKLSLGQTLFREVVGKFLSTIILLLGYLWVAFNKEKQAWHDLLAKTHVIQESPKR